jgi:hypothetical protein
MTLRVAINLSISLRDLDRAKAGGFDTRHHFGPPGEGDLMTAFGENARDAETRR